MCDLISEAVSTVTVRPEDLPQHQVPVQHLLVEAGGHLGLLAGLDHDRDGGKVDLEQVEVLEEGVDAEGGHRQGGLDGPPDRPAQGSQGPFGWRHLAGTLCLPKSRISSNSETSVTLLAITTQVS